MAQFTLSGTLVKVEEETISILTEENGTFEVALERQNATDKEKQRIKDSIEDIKHHFEKKDKIKIDMLGEMFSTEEGIKIYPGMLRVEICKEC